MYQGKRLPKNKTSHEAKKTPLREMSKMLAAWAVTIATASVIVSYTLSAFDRDPCENLTEAIFAGCIAYLVAYAGKSLGEKVSRNRHGLDADGNPYQNGI